MCGFHQVITVIAIIIMVIDNRCLYAAEHSFDSSCVSGRANIDKNEE